jgi:hypothetical protein
MVSESIPRASVRRPVSRLATTIGLLAILAIGIRFIVHYAAPYFQFDPNYFGPRWPYRLQLILHICGGILALLAGPWQLWSGLRRKALGVHRWTGRLYVAGVALGTIGAFTLGPFTQPRSFGVALMSLGTAWLGATAFACVAILRRNVQLHKEWMARSYIMTFGFVSFRAINDGMPGLAAQLGGSPVDALANMVWLSWVLPLAGYELIRLWRRLGSAPQL